MIRTASSEPLTPAERQVCLQSIHWGQFALALSAAFLLTGLIGVWAAYDQAMAWRCLGMIAAGLGLALGTAWAGWRAGRQGLGVIALGCALLSGALGAYFLLSYDWAAHGPGKLAVLQAAGLWVQAHRPALPVPEDIHPNIAAGGLALVLPLGMAGVIWACSHSHWRAAGAGALVEFLGLVGLALTASRGGWLGLVVGVLIATYLEWRVIGVGPTRLCLPGDLLLVGTLLASLAIFAAVLAGPEPAGWLDSLGAGDPAIRHAQLWRNAVVLVGDYPFTGSGLRSTTMIFSSYVLLLHVPFISNHVHNLFLQIALEHGLPGLAAFLGLVTLACSGLARAYRQRRRFDALRWGAATAMITLLVHGMFEAGNYNSRVVFIGFLPLGFALGLAPLRQVVNPRRVRWASLAGSLLAMLILAGLLLPGSRAAFLANLGAVAQARAELGAYRWPDWPMQDALRRSGQVELAPALARYQAALALDPTNPTANRRMGQMALSWGDYPAARVYLEAAYAAAPSQRPTRQLLGECYAVAGELQAAAALWRGVDTSLGQLALRQAWYEWIGEPQHAAWVAQAAQMAARPMTHP